MNITLTSTQEEEEEKGTRNINEFEQEMNYSIN
jgi:hypothetical protein